MRKITLGYVLGSVIFGLMTLSSIAMENPTCPKELNVDDIVKDIQNASNHHGQYSRVTSINHGPHRDCMIEQSDLSKLTGSAGSKLTLHPHKGVIGGSLFTCVYADAKKIEYTVSCDLNEAGRKHFSDMW